MKIIVISNPSAVIDEHAVVNGMLKQGLDYFHLRKPGFDRNQMIQYLRGIQPEGYSRIVIHSHYDLAERFKLGGIHITGSAREKKESILDSMEKSMEKRCRVGISCHFLNELRRENMHMDYFFLSPVFDSISKKGYKGHFDFAELRQELINNKRDVIAMGGCRLENIKKVHELGFKGAAFLGAIWNEEDPLGSYSTIKKYAERLG